MFVYAIFRFLNGAHALLQVERRRNADHGVQLHAVRLVRRAREFGGRLHDYVSSQRKAHQCKRMQPIHSLQFAHHGNHIGAHAGVIKRFRQVQRVTAIAQIQAHHIQSQRERLVRNPLDVSRISTAFQSVNNH